LRGSDRSEKSLALSRFPTSLKWVDNKTLSHAEQKNLLSQTKQFALHDSFMRVFLNNDFSVASWVPELSKTGKLDLAPEKSDGGSL